MAHIVTAFRKAPEAQRRSRRILRSAEALLVEGLAHFTMRLGPTAASNVMGRLFRTLGPHLPVTRVADANLRLALPELGDRARARVIRGMWDSLGRTAGEFAHLAALPKDSAAGPGWTMVNEHVLIEQMRAGGAGDLRLRPYRQLGDAAVRRCTVWHAVFERLPSCVEPGCQRRHPWAAAPCDAARGADVPKGRAGRTRGFGASAPRRVFGIAR